MPSCAHKHSCAATHKFKTSIKAMAKEKGGHDLTSELPTRPTQSPCLHEIDRLVDRNVIWDAQMCLRCITNFMQRGPSFMQRDHNFKQRARCNLWDRLVPRARDLCLAMRLPGRSASRLVWPTLSATSNRTPSKASTAFIHAGNNLVMLLFAS